MAWKATPLKVSMKSQKMLNLLPQLLLKSNRKSVTSTMLRLAGTETQIKNKNRNLNLVRKRKKRQMMRKQLGRASSTSQQRKTQTTKRTRLKMEKLMAKSEEPDLTDFIKSIKKV